MAEYIVKQDALASFYKTLSEGGKRVLLAPKKNGDKFEMMECEAENITLDYVNTHLSPKSAFFPQTEKMMSFHKDSSKEDAFVYKAVGLDAVKPSLLFGLRPCDAKGLAVCDKVFQNNRFTDPYWKSKYDAALKIGLACLSPCANCFCTAVGGSPFGEEGLDVLAFVKDGDLILKSLNTAADDFLKNISGLESTALATVLTEAKKEAESKMPKAIDFKKLNQAEILDVYSQDHWKETAERCLNCGTCTFVCPTCHCFDIQDEQNEEGGIRMRNWDTCMSWLYTIHGTGHNPRPSKTERMRQRFMHKLKYIPMKQDGNCGCIGCGRCVSLCPVNIDIRQVASQMNA